MGMKREGRNRQPPTSRRNAEEDSVYTNFSVHLSSLPKKNYIKENSELYLIVFGYLSLALSRLQNSSYSNALYPSFHNLSSTPSIQICCHTNGGYFQLFSFHFVVSVSHLLRSVMFWLIITGESMIFSSTFFTCRLRMDIRLVVLYLLSHS